jgi:chromosome segregation ATPase
MASGSNVVIRLATEFAGKGVELFRSAMTTTGKIVMKSIGGMADAFGSLVSRGNDAAGQLVRSFGQLGTMIAQGGIWGAATFAVTKLFDTIKERLDAGKRQLEGFAEAFKTAMSRAVEASEAKFRRFTDGLARAVALSQALLGHRKAGDSADASAAVAGVNAQEREALAKASGDSERAVISANAELERAKIRTAEATRAATGDLAEADSAVAQAQKRIAAAEDAVAEARMNYDKATRHRIAVLQSEDRTDQSVAAADEAYAKARGALQKATDELAKAKGDEQLAETAHMTALANARKAETEATEQVAAAEFALAEATRKQEEAARRRAEEQAAFEAEIQAEQERLDAEGDLREAYEYLADQAKKKGREQVRQMQRLNGTILRLQRRYDDALKGIGRTRRGQDADAAHKNGLFGPYQYGGRSNGGENFIDWNRAQRFAGWGGRDDQKAARRDASAQKRYDRIRDALENGESVSKSDEAFFGKFKDYQDQKNGAEKAAAELEKAQKSRDDLQKEMKKTLDEINENIKAALAIG